MSEVERYLRAATRGLWGNKRREVMAELRGHVEARAQEFRMAGLSEAEAERQTLRELGAPIRVSGGMGRVYALPFAARTGALLCLAGVLGLSALSGVGAQVRALDKNTDGLSVVPPYLNLSDLAERFREAGLGANLEGDQLTLSLAGKTAQLSVTAPNSKTYGEDDFLRRNDGAYVRADVLLAKLEASGAKVELRGLNNPVLSVNGKEVNLGTPERPFDARAYFIQRVRKEFSRQYNLGRYGGSYWTDERGAPLTLRPKGRPGELYALVIPDPQSGAKLSQNVTFSPSLLLKVAQADGQGDVRFVLPGGNVQLTDEAGGNSRFLPERYDLHFTDQPEALRRLFGVTLREDQPIPALLLRVNTRLDAAGGPKYQIMPRADVQLER